MYALMRWVMRAITRGYLVGDLFEVTGAEQVPRSGALLVCSNHISTIDPPLLPAFLPRADTWSMGKSEYFERPFVSWVFRRYHAFPVVRHTADRRALRRGLQVLAGGGALILYPEGTRIASGGMVRPEPGAGFLAQYSRAPILPVALSGTRECFPKGARWPRRTRVAVRFGRPFRLADAHEDGSRVRHQEAADAIMLAVAELAPPELRGEFADLDGLRMRLGGLYRPA